MTKEYTETKEYDRIYLTHAGGELIWCLDKITEEDEIYVNAEYIKRILDVLPTSHDKNNDYAYLYNEGYKDAVAATVKSIKQEFSID